MTTYNFQFNSRWLIKTDTTQKITWQRVTMCYMSHCYILVYSTIFIITFSNNTLKNRIMLLFRKGYSDFLLEFLWCVVFGTKTATVSCTRSQKHKNRSNCNHQACLLTPYLGFFTYHFKLALSRMWVKTLFYVRENCVKFKPTKQMSSKPQKCIQMDKIRRGCYVVILLLWLV